MSRRTYVRADRLGFMSPITPSSARKGSEKLEGSPSVDWKDRWTWALQTTPGCDQDSGRDSGLERAQGTRETVAEKEVPI